MSRRRRSRNRRRRSGGTNRWLIGLQVLVCTGVLVFLIVFRDYLSMTATRVVTGLSGRDVDVSASKEERGSRTSPPSLNLEDSDAGGLAPDTRGSTSRETSSED